MSLGMEVGLGPGDFGLDGDPAHPSPKGGRAPPPRKKNSAHVYCGQTAGWMKLVLGMEVGLNPGDFMLDGDHAPPPPKGHRTTIVRPYLLRPNGCMDHDVTWYGARPRPRRLCVRWELVAPSPRGVDPQTFDTC